MIFFTYNLYNHHLYCFYSFYSTYSLNIIVWLKIYVLVSALGTSSVERLRGFENSQTSFCPSMSLRAKIYYKFHLIIIINLNLTCGGVFCRWLLAMTVPVSSSQTQANVAACVLRALAWQPAVARKTPSVSRVKMVSIFKTNFHLYFE